MVDKAALGSIFLRVLRVSCANVFSTSTPHSYQFMSPTLYELSN